MKTRLLKKLRKRYHWIFEQIQDEVTDVLIKSKKTGMHNYEIADNMTNVMLFTSCAESISGWRVNIFNNRLYKISRKRKERRAYSVMYRGVERKVRIKSPDNT